MDWYGNYGAYRHPQSIEALLLCDGGGSNGSRRLLFKEQLQRVADRTQMIWRVAHYPSGCSKFNPIEHPVFPHVERQLRGMLLKSIDLVRDLIRRTSTLTGLKVFARKLCGFYPTRQKATVASAKELCITFAEHLPRRNYTVFPRSLWELI